MIISIKRKQILKSKYIYMAANTTMYSPSYVSHCNIQCYTDTIMYALVGGTIKVDSLKNPLEHYFNRVQSKNIYIIWVSVIY